MPRKDLSTPLKPGLDYFDATAAIKEIEEQLRQLSNRMVQMEKLFELQGSINGRLLESMNAVLLRQANSDSKPAPKLILPN